MGFHATICCGSAQHSIAQHGTAQHSAFHVSAAESVQHVTGNKLLTLAVPDLACS
jgi:hypothetical protein